MKNPKECVCIQQKQTFFILNELAKPECKDGSEPLLFHHDTFSRFRVVIINAEKKPATANISVKEIPGIIQKIQNLNLKQLLAEKTGKTDTQKSAAYTTVITSGRLKGKTPAVALNESEAVNKPLLVNQKNWLQQNLAQYPRNAEQIRAIEEALKLLEEGKLNQTEAESSNRTEVVFHSGMRPLVRRKRADGKCFVYEIEVKFHAGLERPVTIEIHNYYASVVQKETGLLNVTSKDTSSEIHNTFSMTMEQWYWVAHVLETNIQTFESVNAIELYRTAMKEEQKNIEEAKKAGRIAV